MSATRTLRQTLIVCRKELRDSLRDRRALWSILFSVVIGPVLIGFMMNKLADRQRDADAVRIPVVGMHRAPALVNWLNQQAGVQVVEGPAEAEKAVREQREAVVVIVPDDFAERFRSSRPAPLQLVADSSRNDVRPSVQRVQLLLAAVRGRDRQPAPHHARREPGRRAAAGDRRDRGLDRAAARRADPDVHPDVHHGRRLRRRHADRDGLDRWRARARVARTAARESGAARRVRRGQVDGCDARCDRQRVPDDGAVRATHPVAQPRGHGHPTRDRSRSTWVRFCSRSLPMCLFTAALQAAVATLARSFKEAQTYMGVLILGPMLPGVIVALYPIGNAAWNVRHPDARALRSAHRRPRRTRPRPDRVSHVGRDLPARQRDPHSDHDRAVQERTHHFWTVSRSGSGIRDSGFGIRDSGLGIRDSGFGTRGVRCSGFDVARICVLQRREAA